MKQKLKSIPRWVYIVLALLLIIGTAIAVTQLKGKEEKTLAYSKGHKFSMKLEGLEDVEDLEVLPGDVRELSPAVKNTSTTEHIYAFIGLEYNSSAWSVDIPMGWKMVEEGVYAYATGNTMNDLNIGDSAEMDITLTVKATGDAFQALSDSDFVVKVTGYGISTEITDSNADQAWSDYLTT